MTDDAKKGRVAKNGLGGEAKAKAGCGINILDCVLPLLDCVRNGIFGALFQENPKLGRKRFDNIFGLTTLDRTVRDLVRRSC